jgi:sugar phosphate isomerase/epimerase
VDAAVRARVLAGALGVNASFNQGVMTTLAAGAVDIAAVMHRLVHRGYDGPVIVEQDPSDDARVTPEVLARQNLQFLQPLIGD